MIKRLLNIFSGKKESSCCSSPNGLDDIVSFVDYVAKSLVDNPTEVKITTEDMSNNGKVIKIDCKKEDIGKIIGKNGKTIMAIRLLVSCAGNRLNKQVNVEVIDKVAV